MQTPINQFKRKFTRTRLRHFLVLVGLISLGFDFIIGIIQFVILTHLNTWSYTFTVNATTLQNLANSGITLTDIGAAIAFVPLARSEERRVGKEGRCRWWAEREK